MADFVLKNNLFEFNGGMKMQKLRIVIGTKFAPPYACTVVDAVELEYLTSQHRQPFLWLRYIDDIFFTWTHGKEKHVQFHNNLIIFTLI